MSCLVCGKEEAEIRCVRCNGGVHEACWPAHDRPGAGGCEVLYQRDLARLKKWGRATT